MAVKASRHCSSQLPDSPWSRAISGWLIIRADVKLVQARMRHASAKTTLDTYGH
jgi:integrase